MGRRKKEDFESEAPPEVSEDGEPIGPSSDSPVDSGEPEKKKRGPRGPYKKRQKQKVTIPLPDNIIREVALLPFTTTNAILASRKGVVLALNPAVVESIPVVFKVWLDSIGFELTPGWALIALYAGAIATCKPVPVSKAKDEAKKQSVIDVQAEAVPNI